MIRKVLGLTFMVGVVSMFAFACGDDDAAAGDKYPTVDSFCTAKAKLECSAGSVGGFAFKACFPGRFRCRPPTFGVAASTVRSRCKDHHGSHRSRSRHASRYLR